MSNVQRDDVHFLNVSIIIAIIIRMSQLKMTRVDWIFKRSINLKIKKENKMRKIKRQKEFTDRKTDRLTDKQAQGESNRHKK